MILWQIIFWLSVLLVFHSYVLFPWILELLAKNKKENSLKYKEEEFPEVAILLSLYNEEKIIEAKLDSILNSDYPSNKLKVYVGSDASDDKTNAILEAYAAKHSGIKPYIFKERQGKPKVINQLVEEAEEDLLVMTDAKLLFHEATVKGLVSHFKNPKIGIVGGNILNRRIQKDGVSIQENAFMSREILMKYREGLIWGATVGVYGAIYAIRRSLYQAVPKGFSVDDFFISMSVLRKKHRVILDLNVLTYEEVPNRISEEYRRKVRIATGNFKNLGYFAKELLTPWKGASFAYWSHKALRWLIPFILIAFTLACICLFNDHVFYQYSAYGFGVVLFIPILDFLLSKIGIHIVLLRFVSHFLSMNVALLHGYINHLRGIKKDVWQPTKR